MRSGRRCLLAVPLLLAVLSACGDGSGSPSTPPSTPPVPAAACLTPEEVRTVQVDFTSEDDDPLRGVMLGEGPVGVVLAHQAGEDLCQWKPYAQALSGQGYRVLAFTFSVDLEQEVVSAAKLLRARGSTDVVLIGASMGGTAALAASALITPPVAAVVSLSAPRAYSGTDAMPAVSTATVPVLFVAGADDQPFADDAREMHAASKAPGRRLTILETSAHGVDLMDAATTAAVETFITAHAPKPVS